jgi:RHS repeat-associated protein
MRYTWDAGGNLTLREDVSSGETENFAYDYLDRLLSAGSISYSENYAYDLIGNITSKNGIIYGYSGIGAGPHAVTSIGPTAYTYDGNGNMNAGTDREWDVENRLTDVTKDGVSGSFVYDGDGNRVKKTEGGQTTVYVNRYYEKTGAEITTSYYLGSRLVAQRKGTDQSFILQDHLGSTAATTNASGSTTATIKYFSFGNCRNSTGTIPTDRKFTGQRLDSTGLYYYGARYYDDTIGRFISPDTFIQNYTDPQSINRYTYVFNNPLRYTDPTGQFGLGDIKNAINISVTTVNNGLQVAETKVVEFAQVTATKAGEIKQSAMDTVGIQNMSLESVPLNPFSNSGPSIPIPMIETKAGGFLESNTLDRLHADGVTLMPAGIIVRGSVTGDRMTQLKEHEYRHVPQELLLGPAYYLLYGAEYGVLKGLYGDDAYKYQIAEQTARTQNGQQSQGWNWYSSPFWWSSVTSFASKSGTTVSNWGQSAGSEIVKWFSWWWPW